MLALRSAVPLQVDLSGFQDPDGSWWISVVLLDALRYCVCVVYYFRGVLITECCVCVI